MIGADERVLGRGAGMAGDIDRQQLLADGAEAVREVAVLARHGRCHGASIALIGPDGLRWGARVWEVRRVAGLADDGAEWVSWLRSWERRL